MSTTKHYYFAGKCKWAMVHRPDEKYEVYKINVYMDDESFALFDESGCQLKVYDDEDGKYVVFKRKMQEMRGDTMRKNDPPKVLNAEGIVIDDNVGNGSDVVVKVEMYDTRNGVSHRLHSIMVKELVPYEGGETEVIKPEGLGDIPEF